MKNRLIIGIVLLALTLGIVGAVTLSSKPGIPATGGVLVRKVGERAFGTLTKNAPNPASAESSADLAIGRSAYGTVAPQPTVVTRYVYTGSPVALNDATVEVLQRNVPVKGPEVPSSMFSSLGLGIFNVEKLSGSTTQQVALTDNNGYTIFVDMEQGTVSISESAQLLHARCPLGSCENSQPLTEKDVLPDTTLLQLADSFLATYDFDRSPYGRPTVDHQWENGVMATSEKDLTTTSPTPTEKYVPETAQVLYPLRINGKPVLNLSGFPEGVTVVINMRDKKVNGVYGIKTQQYQSSAYKAVQDWKIISDILSKSGSSELLVKDVTTSEDITLASPTSVYALLYHSDSNGTYRDIIVPALAFPVTAKTTSGQNTIIIPLAEELLQGMFPVNTPDVISPPADFNAGSTSGAGDSSVGAE